MLTPYRTPFGCPETVPDTFLALAFCRQRGEAPDRPFSGQFMTRIPPELHRQINAAAALSGKSLNGWVTEQLQAAVQRVVAIKTAGNSASAKKKPAKKASHRKKGVKQRA